MPGTDPTFDLNEGWRLVNAHAPEDARRHADRFERFARNHGALACAHAQMLLGAVSCSLGDLQAAQQHVDRGKPPKSAPRPDHERWARLRDHVRAVRENRPVNQFRLGPIQMGGNQLPSAFDVYTPDAAGAGKAIVESLALEWVDAFAARLSVVVSVDPQAYAFGPNEDWKVERGGPALVGVATQLPHAIDHASVTLEPLEGLRAVAFQAGDWSLFGPGSYPRHGSMPRPQTRAWSLVSGSGGVVRATLEPGARRAAFRLRLRLRLGVDDAPLIHLALPTGTVVVRGIELTARAQRTLVGCGCRLSSFQTVTDPEFAGRAAMVATAQRVTTTMGDPLDTRTARGPLRWSADANEPAVLTVHGTARGEGALDWAVWLPRHPVAAGVYGQVELARVHRGHTLNLSGSRDAEPVPLVVHRVVNRGEAPRRVQLSAALGDSPSVEAFEVPPGGHRDVPMVPPLGPAALRGDGTRREADIELRLRSGDIRAERRHPVQFYAPDVCTWHIEDPQTMEVHRHPEVMARWVTPDDPAVRELVARYERTQAAPEALQIGGDHGADVARMDRVWKVLLAQGLEYRTGEDVDLTRFGAGQRLQFPRDTIARRSGNCLDLTVLLASVFEAIGLPAALVLCTGHAFLGLHRNNSLLGIESTMVARCDARKATPLPGGMDVGRRQLAPLMKPVQRSKPTVGADGTPVIKARAMPPFFKVVLLSQARASGVTAISAELMDA